MKQIIPFKKELLFKTKVSEITSISLEHTLSLKNDDLISGEFHISGDYKMTEGSINREKFEFKLPFDIALDSRYNMASIIIDIDNFYYEIINNESLQVNIDVYVEGEKIVEEYPKPEEILTGEEEKESIIEESLHEEQKEEVFLASKKEEEMVEDRSSVSSMPSSDIPSPDLIMPRHDEFEKAIEKANAPKAILESKAMPMDEFNFFENMDSSDTYVTYYVYVVKEEDTIDKILTKYEVTKEDVALYNDIEKVTPGTKLIIPSHCDE